MRPSTIAAATRATSTTPPATARRAAAGVQARRRLIGTSISEVAGSVLHLLDDDAPWAHSHLHLGRGQSEVVDGLVEKAVQLVARVVVHRALVDEQDVGDHPAVLHPEP